MPHKKTLLWRVFDGQGFKLTASLLQIPDDLMSVGFAVSTAGDVEPVVLAVGGLQYQLVEVSVMFEEIDPAVGNFQVGVPLVILPSSVGGEGQAKVGSLAQCVLRGVGSAHLHVELAAAIATGDDDGLAHEVAKGFKHLLAQLLQHGYVLWGYAVVDAEGGCSG